MRFHTRLFTPVLLISILFACGCSGRKIPATVDQALVGTMVKNTMEAIFSLTPPATTTPAFTPTLTATATIKAPNGWKLYTNEEYGIQFAHPSLYDCGDQCGLLAFLGGTHSIVNLAVESTLMKGDAPFDGISLDVDENTASLSLEAFVEQERQAVIQGPSWLSPPIAEEVIVVGGQTGVFQILPREQMMAVVVPFPHSSRMLIISIGQQKTNSFKAIALQIIETLRFTK
jgi:hypothetical protein